MARRHIIYIPWTYPGEGHEQHDKCITWQSAAEDGDLSVDHHYEIVHYGDGTTLDKLPWGSEIYIRGHGGIGDHEICEANSGANSLKYDQVADRLLSHGLSRTWCGSIKLYNCNSGRCSLGRQSFAAKFAQYMRFVKGYHLVSYVGYLGYLSSYPITGLSEHHLHKRVRIETPLGDIKLKSKWGKAFF